LFTFCFAGDINQWQAYFETQQVSSPNVLQNLSLESLSDRSKNRIIVNLFKNKKEYFKIELEFLQQQQTQTVINAKAILKQGQEKNAEEICLEIFHLFVSFIKSKTQT
jgi:hypothetical protein